MLIWLKVIRNGFPFIWRCEWSRFSAHVQWQSHAGKDGWRILRKSLFCHGAEITVHDFAYIPKGATK